MEGCAAALQDGRRVLVVEADGRLPGSHAKALALKEEDQGLDDLLGLLLQDHSGVLVGENGRKAPKLRIPEFRNG